MCQVSSIQCQLSVPASVGPPPAPGGNGGRKSKPRYGLKSTNNPRTPFLLEPGYGVLTYICIFIVIPIAAAGAPLRSEAKKALLSRCQGIVCRFFSWFVSHKHAWPSSRAGLRRSGRHACSPLLPRLRRRRVRSRSPLVRRALCSGLVALVGRKFCTRCEG